MTISDEPILESAHIDSSDDLLDQAFELPPPKARRVIFTRLTWVLIAVVACAATFYAGVRVEKSQVTGTNTNLAAGFGGTAAAARAGAGGTGANAAAGNGTAGANAGTNGTGAAGFGGGGGAGGFGAARGVTTGQVKLVDGNNVYITDAQGNTVKVTTTDSTQVTKTATAKLSDFQAGDTVLVVGPAGSDGTIAATSVSEGGAVAAFGRGGFGGAGGTGAGGGAGRGATGAANASSGGGSTNSTTAGG